MAKQRKPKKAAGKLFETRAKQYDDLDQAGVIYEEAKSERQALSQREKDAKASFEEKMVSHKLKRYEYDFKGSPFIAEITEKSKIVTHAKKAVGDVNGINPDGPGGEGEDLE